MSNHFLNAEAVLENAHSLAAALGIDTEHAEELLKAYALVTVNESEPLNAFLGEQVSKSSGAHASECRSHNALGFSRR